MQPANQKTKLTAEQVYQQIRLGNPAFTRSPTSLKGHTFTSYQQERLVITACKQGYLAVLEQLKPKKGLGLLEAPLLDGSTTALEQAVLGSQPEIIDYLFQEGVTPQAIKPEAVPQAVARQSKIQPSKAEEDRGSSSQATPKQINDKNKNPAENSSNQQLVGYYPLYWAIDREDLAIIPVLYRKQLSVLRSKKVKDAKPYLCVDTEGKTPLELAIKLKNIEISSLFFSFLSPEEQRASVQKLIRLVSKKSISSESLNTYIEALFYCGQQDYIQLLIDAYIIQENTVINNYTPGDLAIKYDHPALFVWLVEEKHFRSRGSQKNSAIIAAKHGALAMLEAIKTMLNPAHLDYLLITAIKNEQWQTAEWLGTQLIESGRTANDVRAQMIMIAILYSQNSFIEEQLKNPDYLPLFFQNFAFEWGQICDDPKKIPACKGFAEEFQHLDKKIEFSPLDSIDLKLTGTPFVFSVLWDNNLTLSKIFKASPEWASSLRNSANPLEAQKLYLLAAVNHHTDTLNCLTDHLLAKDDRDQKLDFLQSLAQHFINNDLIVGLKWLVEKAKEIYQEESSGEYILQNWFIETLVKEAKVWTLRWLDDNSELLTLPQKRTREIIQTTLKRYTREFVEKCIENDELDNLKWLVRYLRKNLKSILEDSSTSSQASNSDELMQSFVLTDAPLKSFLLSAAKHRRFDILKWLVEEQNADISFKTSFKAPYQQASEEPKKSMSFLAALICKGRSPEVVKWLVETKGETTLSPEDIGEIISYSGHITQHLRSHRTEENKDSILNPIETMPEIFADLIFIDTTRQKVLLEVMEIKEAIDNLIYNNSLNPEKINALSLLDINLRFIQDTMNDEQKARFSQRFSELLTLPQYAKIKHTLESVSRRYPWLTLCHFPVDQSGSSSSFSFSTQGQSGYGVSLPFVGSIGDRPNDSGPSSAPGEGKKKDTMLRVKQR